MVEEKLFSLKRLEDLAAGSDDFVQSMVETFIEHLPKQVSDLVDAFKIKDYKRMADAAHKVKPSLDLFEIKGLKEVIRSIEKQGRHGDIEPNLADEIELFQNRALAALEAMSNNDKEEPTQQ